MQHGEWTKWLEDNCPDISEETARLYMRLADPKNADKLEKAAEENGNAVAEMSVRGAAKALRTPLTHEQKARRDANKGKANKAASVTIEKQLKALDADEVFKGLRDAHWEVEQLTKLAKLLNDHLAALRRPPVPTSPPNTLTEAAAIRRPI